VLVLGVLSGCLPGQALIGLVGAVIAVPAYYGARRYHSNMEKLVPYMGMNVVINLLTPVLIAVGLFIA
jgi:1,4-dihydroxy-2-naphthoate octaprenyltransferase